MKKIITVFGLIAVMIASVTLLSACSKIKKEEPITVEENPLTKDFVKFETKTAQIMAPNYFVGEATNDGNFFNLRNMQGTYVDITVYEVSHMTQSLGEKEVPKSVNDVNMNEFINPSIEREWEIIDFEYINDDKSEGCYIAAKRKYTDGSEDYNYIKYLIDKKDRKRTIKAHGAYVDEVGIEEKEVGKYTPEIVKSLDWK